jgi:hypothetical protein
MHSWWELTCLFRLLRVVGPSYDIFPHPCLADPLCVTRSWLATGTYSSFFCFLCGSEGVRDLQLHALLLCCCYLHFAFSDLTEGRDSSVDIATRYGLDGPGIESRWGRDLCTRLDRPWDPPSFLYSGYRVSLPRVKRPGRGVDHPPLSRAEVKERVELCFCPPPWGIRGLF